MNQIVENSQDRITLPHRCVLALYAGFVNLNLNLNLNLSLSLNPK